MKNLFLILLFAITFIACSSQKENSSLIDSLQQLEGKWVISQTNDDFYTWNRQDSTYLGAKYSIIEQKDSLRELHSIQKVDNNIYYQIDKVDVTFPETKEFQLVEHQNNTYTFSRQDSLFPQQIILTIQEQQLTITQQGKLDEQIISLPLVYNKQ